MVDYTIIITQHVPSDSEDSYIHICFHPRVLQARKTEWCVNKYSRSTAN